MTIEVQHLTKSYDGTAVVNDLNFAVPSGTVVGFVGPNGAGKTTTMRMMVGLIDPDHGTATFDGKPYRQLEHPLATVGVVLGGTTGHPRRRVSHHLRALARATGSRAGRADEVLEEVGLAAAAGKRVGRLSLGMGQRLALAEALIARPRHLLLDEPFIGLDMDGIRWLRSLLRRAAGDGVGILLSNHHMAEMELLADRLLVIGRGEVLADSAVTDLVSNHGSSRVLVHGAARGDLVTALAMAGFDPIPNGRGVEIRVDGRRDELMGVLARAGVHRTECLDVEPTIEDVFVDLTANRSDHVAAEVH